MNQIINKFSLAWDKFMPEIHLKQPWQIQTFRNKNTIK